MKSLWLYLHFPHLQLDALLTANKEAQQQPVAIVHERKNIVLQANQCALGAGISRGMGLGSAAALEHNLQVLPYQYDIEENLLQEIATQLYQVTSDISLLAPDGLLLRIHNMLHLYGGLEPYWKVVRQQLEHFAVGYHFATGHSGLAARMLARQQQDRICSDVQQHKKAVNSCPIVATELDLKTQQKLSRVGITKVADLLALPMKDVAKRFDCELVSYLGRLSGEFFHSLPFFTPPSYFKRYLELLYEITHSQSLTKPILILLEAMEQFLKVRDLLTNKIVLGLSQRDNEPLTLEVGSAQGEYQASKWLQLANLKLENLQLQAPVYALHLSCPETYLRSPEKADLFSPATGSLTALQLISMLEAKLGDDSVFKIVLDDDFRPEKTSRYNSPHKKSMTKLDNLHSMRPSFLLTSPQPLQDKISIISGPERIDTGWWDNQPVVRDYYIGRSGQGQWLWVFKTPQNLWFVQGLFS